MGDVVSFKYKENEEEMELKAITGGNTPTGINWLSDLDVGTVFLAKDKTSADFSLMYLCIVEKTAKSVKVASPELPTPRFVEPIRFCQKFGWHETLGIIKDEETPEVAPVYQGPTLVPEGTDPFKLEEKEPKSE